MSFNILNKALPGNIDRYLYYKKIIAANRIKRIFSGKIENKFLFILSPPFCGSTLLNQIISQSDSVSVNNNTGTREGQRLPGIERLLYKGEQDARWDTDFTPEWQIIKKIWLKHWDLTKPVLLDKSPPNIIRAEQIEKHFNPVYFLIFYRNPYAYSESLMRINSFSPHTAAKFVIKCLKFQKLNIEMLSNSIRLSYEYLTENTEESLILIKNFLKELSDIEISERTFSAHNFKDEEMGIKNLNNEKISKLKPKVINELNKIFKSHENLLNFFNYEIL